MNEAMQFYIIHNRLFMISKSQNDLAKLESKRLVGVEPPLSLTFYLH